MKNVAAEMEVRTLLLTSWAQWERCAHPLWPSSPLQYRESIQSKAPNLHAEGNEGPKQHPAPEHRSNAQFLVVEANLGTRNARAWQKRVFKLMLTFRKISSSVCHNS